MVYDIPTLGEITIYPGFSLQFFVWRSLGLLQPRVEAPEEESGGLMVSIVFNSRGTMSSFGR